MLSFLTVKLKTNTGQNVTEQNMFCFHFTNMTKCAFKKKTLRLHPSNYYSKDISCCVELNFLSRQPHSEKTELSTYFNSVSPHNDARRKATIAISVILCIRSERMISFKPGKGACGTQWT